MKPADASQGLSLEQLERVSLLTSLRNRRSRRFGLGMKIPAGPLAFESRFQPSPLSEEEEAALVFAACGVTGHVRADLNFSAAGGGNIMAGLVGRTIASGDGMQTVALVVTNDTGTHLVRRPREMLPAEIPALVELGRQGKFTEAYRRSRVRILEQRAAPPVEPLFNININRWSANAQGTTYFLPINDLTLMYINGLLEVLNEDNGVYVLDERNGYRPAGLTRFARSRGGHLEDDPRKMKVVTVRHVEQFVNEFVTVEQGMMLQNLGLMTQALGLGGHPSFANHEFGWFQALGFRMAEMPASRYLGVGPLVSAGMRLLGRDVPIPYPVGLERNGEALLKPFCPPFYPSMKAAVQAVVELKFGRSGIFRGPGHGSAWANHDAVTSAVPGLSERAIAATIAYGEYVFGRYGRFPAYMPPYRTVLGFQVGRPDEEFYHRFYCREASDPASP